MSGREGLLVSFPDVISGRERHRLKGLGVDEKMLMGGGRALLQEFSLQK